MFDVPWTCKWQWVAVALACFIVLLVVPFFDPEHQRAQRCLAMLVFVTILWVTGNVNIHVDIGIFQRIVIVLFLKVNFCSL